MIFFMSVSICIFLFAAINVHAVSGTLNISGTQNYGEAWDVLDLVNEYRAAEGLQPLAMDSALLDAAMLRAAECAVYYSHTRPDGNNCFTAVDWRNAVGENIAAMDHIANAAYVMNGWMNSDGHRANIMSDAFTSIGIGVFEANGFQYWVQLFDGGSARPAESSAAVSASYQITTDEALIVLGATQNTSVSFHGGQRSGEGFFSIDKIYNLNFGWEFVIIFLDNTNFVFHSSDPNVAEVNDGVITPTNAGTAAVTVSLADFPNKSIVYNVTVTDHRFSDWKTVKNATCSDEGEMISACDYCDTVNSQAVAATGEHNFDSGTVGNGVITYKCQTDGCTVSYTEEIPAVTESSVIPEPEIVTEPVVIPETTIAEETVTEPAEITIPAETTAEEVIAEVTEPIMQDISVEKHEFTVNPSVFIIIIISIFAFMVIVVAVTVRRMR